MSAKFKQRPPAASLERVVSLRCYLEAHMDHFKTVLATWQGTKDGRLYWKNGARKIKEHWKTVKAIEREAQANAPDERPGDTK